jgi:hypothetical protein
VGSRRPLRRPTARAASVVLEVAPDRRRRLSDAALVEASVVARLFGMPILKINATVALVPADVTTARSAVHGRPARESIARSGDPPGRPGGGGGRLADAVRHLNEGEALLAKAQRNGS